MASNIVHWHYGQRCLLELKLLDLIRIGCCCVALLIVGCSPKGQDKAPWPAAVHFESLSQSEIETLTNSLELLSTNVGTSLFYFDAQKGQFDITITKMNSKDGSNSKAGLATYDGVFCKVELNDVVLDPTYTGYVDPVLWHEIGHCSGMSHLQKSGEIMYYIASPKDFYKSDAFTNFYNSLLKFTSLSLK